MLTFCCNCRCSPDSACAAVTWTMMNPMKPMNHSKTHRTYPAIGCASAMHRIHPFGPRVWIQLRALVCALCQPHTTQEAFDYRREYGDVQLSASMLAFTRA